MTALVLIGGFTVLMMALQLTMGGGTNQDDTDAGGAGMINQSVVLTMGDRWYGPQSWRPFSPPLDIDPAGDGGQPSADGWYLTFVDLNGTPEGQSMYRDHGTPLKVTYQVQNLSGRMIFDVYGWGDTPRKYWTNRQTGFGANGYVVSGTAEEGEPPAGAAPLSEASPYAVNVAGRDLTTSSGPVNISFDRPWSGLDALHITTNPVTRKGQMTNTTDMNGSFYVSYTGGNEVEHVLLMIAVDRPQPDAFTLSLTSGPEEAA